MAKQGQVSVSPFAAAYLVERFDAYPHPLLRVGRPPVSEGQEARLQAIEQGRQDLLAGRLLENDQLHPFLRDAWNFMCRPPFAIGIAVHAEKGTDFNAVLVEHGRITFQAYQADADTPEGLEPIVLSMHEHGGPIGNSVNLLGTLNAGSAGSASIPAEMYDNAVTKLRGNPSSSIHRALTSAGVRNNDAQMMARALGSHRTQEAAISIRMHDPKVNRTHKLPFNLQVITTEEGCYMMHKRPGNDGREWFTVAPADQRRLTAKLDELAKLLQPTVRS